MPICPASMLFQLTKWFVLKDHCYGQWGVVFHLPSWMESSRCSAGSVKELRPDPPPNTSGRCRGVNASGILLPYYWKPEAVSQRKTQATRQPYTLHRHPSSWQAELRDPLRVSWVRMDKLDCVILGSHVPLSQPHPDGSKTRCCFHPSSCYSSGLAFYLLSTVLQKSTFLSFPNELP